MMPHRWVRPHLSYSAAITSQRTPPASDTTSPDMTVHVRFQSLHSPGATQTTPAPSFLRLRHITPFANAYERPTGGPSDETAAADEEEADAAAGTAAGTGLDIAAAAEPATG